MPRTANAQGLVAALEFVGVSPGRVEDDRVEIARVPFAVKELKAPRESDARPLAHPHKEEGEAATIIANDRNSTAARKELSRAGLAWFDRRGPSGSGPPASSSTPKCLQGQWYLPGLSHSAFETWAGDHPDEVICNFKFHGQMIANVPCGNGPGGGPSVKVAPGGSVLPTSPAAVNRAQAIKISDQDYKDYAGHFLSPSVSLMVRAGLWLELDAALGSVVGLGLASLMGQRTVPVILLIVLEIVLTPLLAHSPIPYLLNVQRSLVGLAVVHVEPGGLPSPSGGNNGRKSISGVTESTTVAVCVMFGWLVEWTALGAWRMVSRDA